MPIVFFRNFSAFGLYCINRGVNAGLLIEITQFGLPVFASEPDDVRDVIQPAETFDPNAPVSIARAVRYFLKNPEPAVQIRSAEEFLAEMLT